MSCSMRYLFILTAICAIGFRHSPIDFAHAWEEEGLSPQLVQVTFEGNEQTGDFSCKIHFDAETAEFKEFRVRVFGSEFELSEAEVLKLKGYTLDRFSVTQSGGGNMGYEYAVNFRFLEDRYSDGGMPIMYVTIGKRSGHVLRETTIAAR